MNKSKYILFIFFVLINFNISDINAQTFPFTSGTIPLCDTVIFTANVTGVNILQPPGPGPGSTLTGIIINITSNHPQTLKVTLTSPVGTNLLLAEFLGAGGTDYISRNFVYAGSPSITTGSPPFTGNFLAQGGSFNIFDGEDPNGPWTITVVDTACFNIPPGGTGGGPWTPSYFNGAASADGGIAIGNGAPLPVTLISLVAEQHDEVITIEWITASEVNNAYFDIERSTDLNNFEWIGRVFGNGTTSTINKYSFTDENPFQGTLYYRLKQTDFDGKIEYYGSIAVEYSPEYTFDIISSFKAIDGNLQIIYSNSTNGKVVLKIHDVSGKLVYFDDEIISIEGSNSLTISANNFSGGIYIFSLSNGPLSKSVKLVTNVLY